LAFPPRPLFVRFVLAQGTQLDEQVRQLLLQRLGVLLFGEQPALVARSKASAANGGPLVGMGVGGWVVGVVDGVGTGRRKLGKKRRPGCGVPVAVAVGFPSATAVKVAATAVATAASMARAVAVQSGVGVSVIAACRLVSMWRSEAGHCPLR
jgi:hypothetical protein